MAAGNYWEMRNPVRFRLKRMARRLLWPRPALYFPTGVLRGHGNVFRSDFQLYISGFPRSGNTFAVKAFLGANPGTLIRSHKHIPAFVVQSVKQNTPGMVLIRKPLDAALSWSIYKRHSLQETLAYYNDYYSVLLPYRDALHFVSFEDVTEDFGKVTEAFNQRWGTAYGIFEHSPENVARCMTEIESEYVDSSGNVIENKVARPSVQRRAQKEMFLAEFNRSKKAQAELYRAEEYYRILAPQPFAPRHSVRHQTSTQHISLRPAV